MGWDIRMVGGMISLPARMTYAIALTLIALVTAACGSGDADDPDDAAGSTVAEAEAPDTTEAEEMVESEEEESEESEESADTGESLPETLERPIGDFPVLGSARVTIGDVSYEFALLECLISTISEDTLEGSGYSYDTDDPERQDFVQFRIAPAGSPDVPSGSPGQTVTVPHAIIVQDVDEDLDWNAGYSPFLGPITYEHSRILDWTRDGMTASGTALFIEENYAYSQDENADYPEPTSTEGSFEIDCREQ